MPGEDYYLFFSNMKTKGFFLKTLFFLKTFFFYSTLSFTTKLRGRYRDFPWTPCPYTCLASSIINITQQNGTFFFSKDESTVIHLNPLKSIVHITIHFRCCTVYGFAQYHNEVYPSL